MKPDAQPNTFETQNIRIKKEERHVLSRFYYAWQIKRDFVGAPEGPERLSYLIGRLKKRYAYIFQDKGQEFEILINELSGKNFSNDEEMLRVITDEIFAFAKVNFTRQQLEKRRGELGIEDTNKFYLNEIFEYSLDDQGKKIRIHLKPTSKMGIEIVKSGFRDLAAKLEQDPTLINVEFVSITSWIVAEKPGAVEKLGFHIDKDVKERGTMARAEFMERYSRRI
jgi:hypothetical protein